MSLPKRMSGSIDYLKEDHIRTKLKDISSLIDSVNLINTLSENDTKEIQKTFVQQKVNKESVQTIIGTNYRINLFENNSLILVNTIKNATSFEKNKYEDELIKLGFIFKSYLNGNSNTLKLSINIENHEDDELVQLFTLLQIK